MSSILKPGVNNVSNRDYHGDNEYLSSSGLKLLLKNPGQFYREKILGEGEPLKGGFLDEGSLCHSLILEPDKVSEEFAFFKGWTKRGKEWEQFVDENPNKILISEPQKYRCEQYQKAYMKRPEAQALLSGGFPEHTVCTKLLGVPVKVRADYINVDKGYIVDIKTSGQPAHIDVFRSTVTQFSYQLSAALYSQAFYDHYRKNFDFYFIVISKQDLVCDVYKASLGLLAEGHIMVNRALATYKKCIETGQWTIDSAKDESADSDGTYEIQEL